MADISNANVAPNLSVDKLENEHTTLISLGIDESGSMTPYEDVVRENLRKFQSSLIGSKQCDEMLVSVTRFNGDIHGSGFQLVYDILDFYSADGMTSLYDTIIVMKNQLISYSEQLKNNGIRVKSVCVLFSDGEDTSSVSKIRDANDAVAEMLKQEIVVAFVAFGSGAKGIAQQLGISESNTLEVNSTVSELRRAFDVLSKSAISVSKNIGTTASTAFFV